MPDANVHEMWSDADLDTALATLRSDVDTADLGRARAELVRAAGGPEPARIENVPPERAHWPRWAAVAAAVVVLVAGAFVVQRDRAHHDEPARPPVTRKQDIVNRIGAIDQPLRPGQFHYVASHAWLLGQSNDYGFLAEILTDTWVPAQPRAEWLQHRAVTGKRKWLFGSEAQAKQEGGLNMWTSGTWHAPCGAFGQETSLARCDVRGSWAEPSLTFFNGLPRNARKMYDVLRADGGDAYVMVDRVLAALRGGSVPKDLRAAFYHALAMSPGVRITEHVANADGYLGTSFSADSAGGRTEFIVDPETGRFIGERFTTMSDEPGMPKGTVVADSSLTYAVVDHREDKPR